MKTLLDKYFDPIKSKELFFENDIKNIDFEVYTDKSTTLLRSIG